MYEANNEYAEEVIPISNKDEEQAQVCQLEQELGAFYNTSRQHINIYNFSRQHNSQIEGL